MGRCRPTKPWRVVSRSADRSAGVLLDSCDKDVSNASTRAAQLGAANAGPVPIGGARRGRLHSVPQPTTRLTARARIFWLFAARRQTRDETGICGLLARCGGMADQVDTHQRSPKLLEFSAFGQPSKIDRNEAKGGDELGNC
jgi:hypothetical protein